MILVGGNKALWMKVFWDLIDQCGMVPHPKDTIYMGTDIRDDLQRRKVATQILRSMNEEE